jgi:hypothetical protein
VVFEMSEGGEVKVRWERAEQASGEQVFELLGRAFEVAQREAGVGFAEAMTAFFRGAMVGKGDVEEVLRRMEK